MKKWHRLLSSKGAVLAIAASFVVVLLPGNHSGAALR